LGKFKGIVFDLDGTLVDTEIDFRQMKREMIKELEIHGVVANSLTPEMTTVIIQENAERIWAELNMPETERVRLRNEMTRLMDAAEMRAIHTLKVICGASEAVRLLSKMGYRLGILTRSNHAYAVEAIRKMDVEMEFMAVLGRGDTTQPKPYAEAMIEAAKALQLEVNEVLMVGDHSIDSTCAVNGGCYFIGVATGPRGEKSWEQNRPEVILKSVMDLPIYLYEKFS
jgi:phosphoglycolate phosphatase